MTKGLCVGGGRFRVCVSLSLLWAFVLCICIVSKRGKYVSNVSTHHHAARCDGQYLNCNPSKLMLCFTNILCCFTSCDAKQTAHYLLRLLTTNILLTTFFFARTTHARRSSGRLKLRMYCISFVALLAVLQNRLLTACWDCSLPTHCSLPSFLDTQHTRRGAQAD